jgi:hypothetical protein
VLGAAAGWNPTLFRAYYYLGGIVLVGVLALGTVYLLAPRLAPFALFTLAGLSVLGLVAVLGADVRAEPLLTHQVPPLRAIPPEGGLFNATRFGSYDLFYVGQAAGVAVMFLGFLSAQQVRLPSRASRSTA